MDPRDNIVCLRTLPPGEDLARRIEERRARLAALAGELGDAARHLQRTGCLYAGETLPEAEITIDALLARVIATLQEK